MTQKYTRLLSIRLQPNEYDWIVTTAEKAGISAGKMIRDIIFSHTENGPKADP